MILRHYTRHRKPIGPREQVTITDIEGQTPSSKPSSAAAKADGEADPAKTAAAIFSRPAIVEGVLRAASPIGPGIQLRCPGFLSNSRQHRMFGLASLELAQMVRGHWDSLKAGGAGAIVPDAGSSTWQPRKSGVGNTTGGGAAGAGRHPVGYRDLFDVAVRWRQLSEPNDPVWWIDRLTPSAFREGFGLQTPMVNGQLKVIWCCLLYARTVVHLLSVLQEWSRSTEKRATLWDRALLGVACQTDAVPPQFACLFVLAMN